MRKVLKRISSVLLAGLLASNLLSVNSNVNAEEKIQIEFWHRNSDNIGGTTINELVEEFNSSQDKIEVTPVFNSGEYQGLMQSIQAEAAAGNELPAITMIGWSYLDYFASNFSYIPLNTVIERNAEDAEFLSSKFEESMLNLAKHNDELVGLSYSVSVPILFLNTELLEEAGVKAEELTTWEAVAEAAKTINEKTGKYGLYINESPDNWNVQQMVESNGAKIIDDNKKAAFASEGGLEAYQLYQDVVQNGSALHVSSEEGTQAFITGEVGIGHFSIANRTNITKNAQFEVVGVPAPTFEGQELNVPAGGAFLTILAEEEEIQDAAWEFLKFLYEPDNIAAWTMGTGYVPVTVDAPENDEIKDLIENDSMMSSAYQVIPNLIPWASFPGSSGLQAEQLLVDLRDQILGGSNVEETVANIQDQINTMLP